MERLEDLNIENLKVYQDDELYKFTSDSIIISKFTKVKKNDVVADFCAGSGIVGFNLFAMNKNLIKSVTFFEMQKSLFSLCEKSISYNGLNDKMMAENKKIQEIGKEYNEKFSLIVCNPPYCELKRGEGQEDEKIAMCRREVYLSLEELVTGFSKALKFGGRVCFCHRADRLTDIFCCLKKFNLEPKRLQTVSGKGKEPYLVLIEAVKGGKTGLKILNNIEN